MASRLAGTGIFILATILSAAQNGANPSQPATKLSLTLAKSVYGVGEEIEATVVLENVGTNSFYVPKYFNMADDLGFAVHIVRNGEPYCFVQAQVTCGKAKRRSVDQVLRDDFFLLQPGGLIGLHVRLSTKCMGQIRPLPPGTYEVAAEYSSSGGCLPSLGNKHTPFPVLQAKVETVYAHLELTEK